MTLPFSIIATVPDFEKYLVRKRRNVFCVESEWIKRVGLVRIQCANVLPKYCTCKEAGRIILWNHSGRCLRVTVRAVKMEWTKTRSALLSISKEIIRVTFFRTLPITVGVVSISQSSMYHGESTIQFTRKQLNDVIRGSLEHLLAGKFEHLMTFFIKATNCPSENIQVLKVVLKRFKLVQVPRNLMLCFQLC